MQDIALFSALRPAYGAVNYGVFQQRPIICHCTTATGKSVLADPLPVNSDSSKDRSSPLPPNNNYLSTL